MNSAGAGVSAVSAALGPARHFPDKGEESRTVPRVTVERPGRLQVGQENGEAIALSVGVVDISATACRVVLASEMLPPGWRWETGLPGALTADLEPGSTLTFPVRLIWSQRTHQGFFVLGFEFAGFASETAKDLDRFILLRMRVGLDLHGKELSEDMEALPLPLSADSRVGVAAAPAEAGHAVCHLQLLDMGPHKARLQLHPRAGDAEKLPSVDDFLDVSVHAPAWAGVDTRSLRFAARVTDVCENSIEIEFASDGHDLQQMVRQLLPREQLTARDRFQLDFIYVILAILVFLVYFLIQLN